MACGPKGHAISIHALLAESDDEIQLEFNSLESFLSTLSLRRATQGVAAPLGQRHYFYPRSPCGERLQTVIEEDMLLEISIHALLAESDK